jgi:hypothetical protein
MRTPAHLVVRHDHRAHPPLGDIPEVHSLREYCSNGRANVSQESGNQTTSSHDVFVSYASQDTAVANSIVESLEGQGLKCWIAPRDVKPGAQYADAIVRAINETRAVVLVMSGSAVDSAHVALAIEGAASKHIIAFRIDTAPLNHAGTHSVS